MAAVPSFSLPLSLSLSLSPQVRSRGLPDDFPGASVRVVEIEGVDSNMCCGTHVCTLAHLQVHICAVLVAMVWLWLSGGCL